MRASLSISYRQLERPLDRHFRLLSLVPGTDFTVVAAARTLGLHPEEAEEAVRGLVDCQLLEQSAPDRFRFHDLVRVFARELAERTESDSERREVLLRCVEWYRDQADHWFSQARYEDAPTPQGLAWFDLEGANALAALRAAYGEQAWQPVMRLAEAVRDFFRYRGLTGEAEQVLRLGLEAARQAGEPAAEVTALIYLTMLLREMGKAAETPELYERGLQLADEHDESSWRAWTLVHFGDACLESGAAGRAVDLYREALESPAWQENDEKRAWTLTHLGIAYRNLGRHDDALAVYEKAWELNHRLANELNAGWVLVHRADTLVDLHRWDEAEGALREAHEQGVRSKDLARQAWVLQHLATLHLARGDIARARESALAVNGLAREMRNERLAETAAELLQEIIEQENS